MYRVVKGHKTDLPDLGVFLDILNRLGEQQIEEVRELFDPRQELVVTRAPGRLDVMGGIADYSGSMVLELPIHEGTFVALQRDPDRRLQVVSLSDEPNEVALFGMPFSDFEGPDEPIDYEVARANFQSDPKHHWAAYVAGVFLVLMRERGINFPQGARILISSTVPAGKGVSSSAALEVAVMQAVVGAFDIELQPRELAILCQKVENMIVGAPCGIMDQMTSVWGEAGRLLALLCQPAELLDAVAIPDDVAFWGIDSGIRHSVAGAKYGTVRAGAFMGYRIIAELAGLKMNELSSGKYCEIDDARWGGYLANVTPREFERDYAHRLPEHLSGAEFLARYKATTDRVGRVDPDQVYAVRIPTAHPIYEHQRVRRFAELLCRSVPPRAPLDTQPRGAHGGRALQLLGELMYQSHDSYSACGLNSDGTDLLVDLVRRVGPARGLYGAKITGAGSGGTVAVLGTPEAGPGIEMVCEMYGRETGRRPYVFTGSSPGSAAFGHLNLEVVN